MDYWNSNFDSWDDRKRGGRLNAARTSKTKKASGPSAEELAPYSTINYTSRGSKGSVRHDKRKRFTITAIAAAVVLLLIIPGVALAVNGKSAMGDAKVLANQGSTLASQIQAGEVQEARRTATDLSVTAKKLDDNVNSLLWAPLTLVPVYGEDVRQVRALASVARKLSEQVLIPITESLPTEGNTHLFVDGGFNIPFIQAVLAPIGKASPTIQQCARQMNGMGTAHIEQLQAPVEMVKQALDMLDEVSGYAGDLSQALPGIFGVNGPRTYLLLACSEAELRSVNGFPGSVGLMTMDNGKMQISEMESPEMPFYTEEESPVKPTEEERIIFGSRVGQYFCDAGYIPHFPRVAEIMKTFWEASGRPPINGVISVDPVFLQSVLELTGSITTQDGVVVDGTNAAQMLMNVAYIMYSAESMEAEAAENSQSAVKLAEERQNAFFTEVASLALNRFFENIGSVNMLEAIQVLGDSIADKRIYMWSADANEQQVIEKLDAACSVSASETEPELGVYLSTTIGYKGNWYLSADTTVGDGKKNADGSTSYLVTTRITNTLTPEDAQNLPKIITNPDQYARDRIRSLGDMILDIYLFAPVGGTISDVKAEGYFEPETLFDDNGSWYTRPGVDPMTKTSYNGQEVWYGVTGIEGLQSTTLTYTVTTSPNAVANLVVDSTPLGQW